MGIPTIDLWGMVLGVLEFVVEVAVAGLPLHESMGLEASVGEVMTSGPVLVSLLLGQVVSLELFFSVLVIQGVLEGARLVYAAYRLLLKLIPTAG